MRPKIRERLQRFFSKDVKPETRNTLQRLFFPVLCSLFGAWVYVMIGHHKLVGGLVLVASMLTGILLWAIVRSKQET